MLAVYLLIAAGIGAGTAILLPKVTRQIGEAASQLSGSATSLRSWEQRWSGYYDRADVPPDVRESIDRSVLGAGNAAADYARGSLAGLVGALSSLPWLAMIPILGFFLLKDAQAFRRAALRTLRTAFDCVDACSSRS